MKIGLIVIGKIVMEEILLGAESIRIFYMHAKMVEWNL